ncbi:hypothetical protein [Enterovirga aerilata]|uniref:Polysaccharide deacetylase n=1 Tax=Enterovirga aerilata TaxID=2730920 RepID=A0A849IFH6_9HYPH|nr:hypothetical protein [Enterovirga sp. DB1703]NNM74890.1 hypothetical protein [Enterovirga sp. DB1703]
MNLAPVRAVLDRAADDGARLEFWWRDDDAVAGTGELDRLLALARRFGAPVAVAAIPARIGPSLPERLRQEPGCRLLVHGFSHANHAAPGRKSAEFGDDRPVEALSADAALALGMMRKAAGDLLLPVFVPPWNRIAPALAEALGAQGYAGLSAFGPRHRLPGIAVVNTHLDPVDWRGTRSALAPERLAGALERALAREDAGPIGLLTHHLMFDEALWRLTEAVAELLADHPAVTFPDLAALWGAEERH